MKQHPWGWNPTGRRRWSILLLWLGHVFIVLLGRTPEGPWHFLTRNLASPGLSLSSKYQAWKDYRAKRVTDLGQARQELLSTRAQLEQIRKEQIQTAQKTSEYEEAIRALGLKQLLPLETSSARIIANLRRAPFGGLVIDRGRDINLQDNQGVICPEGVVGRIWSAGPHQSSVLPLDAYNASAAVMLARSRATGVLQGTGPNRAEIRYIGTQEVAQVGEPVYTSGLDRIFPRGLLVGYISAVRPGTTELGLEVTLSAPLDRTHLVLILPPKPPLQVYPPDMPQTPIKPPEVNAAATLPAASKGKP